MQNFTVVMLNESVSKTDIENYFGSSLLSINQMSNYDQVMSDFNGAMESNWTEDSASSCEAVSSSQWSQFLAKFAPNVQKYSERSYLLKSTTNASRAGWEVVNSAELKSPLYFNQALGGWVTSVKNGDIVTAVTTSPKKTTRTRRTKTAPVRKASTRVSTRASTRASTRVSRSKAQKTANKRVGRKTRSSKRVSKKQSIGELSGFSFSNYKNGLLLVSDNSQSEGEKYFHGGYWNQTLGGWVFSKKQEAKLVSLGASKQ